MARLSKQERAAEARKVGGKVAGRGRPKATGSEATEASKPKAPKGRVRAVARQAAVSERKVRKAEKLEARAKELLGAKEDGSCASRSRRLYSCPPFGPIREGELATATHR